MVIGIFGENCTGKSTLAEKLKKQLNAEVYSGKDYLRFAKNEDNAKLIFKTKLQDANDVHIIYVITEKDHLTFLPENAIRVLVTADLEIIKERFAKRMHGNLPAPVVKLLESKHGCFDQEPHHIHMVSQVTDLENVCCQILKKLEH